MDKLYLVVPCYNEQEVLPETARRLAAKFDNLISAGKISPESRVVFVDDGSKDKTWEIIEGLNEKTPLFRGIKLSRNKGHQNALLAGLMAVKDECDMTISMDADLQDDIDCIDAMVEKYYYGNDVVYGVRSERKTDSAFKRITAHGFYKIMKLLGADIIYNHADYRLMSARALDALAEFKEVNLFLRGIVPLVGFKSNTVEYKRTERFAGKSKYPLKKMISFALNGITSFSIKPIRMITALGVLIFSVSILMLVYFLIRHFTGNTVQGWTTLAASVWAIGGLQLLAIGVVGEYIGKIYMETKARPKYVIEKYIK